MKYLSKPPGGDENFFSLFFVTAQCTVVEIMKLSHSTPKYVAVSFILFGLWPLLSDVLVNGEDVDILNYVMNSHIELAYCRLNCFQGDPICWNQCSGKSFGKANSKVQFTLQPIGLSLLPKDCGLIWTLRLPESFQPLDDCGIIYQIYSQDDQGAWHNEGQTRLNWINMTPNSMGRTKAIKLIAITQSKDHPRLRQVGVASIPFPAAKASNSVQCTVRKARESQNQEEEEKEEEEQQVPQTANFFVTNGLYLGITVGGVCCALVGFGIAVAFFVIKRKRPSHHQEHIYHEPKIYHTHSDIEVANGSFQFHTAL